MEDKFEAVLKELRSGKCVSIKTHSRSEINDMHNIQPSGSECEQLIE